MQKTSHAIFNRIYVRLGFAAALMGGFSLSSQAAYTQLSPPPGWSNGAGGGQFTYGSAANSATIANGSVRTNVALNVAGKSVSIPASLRFAANAPRIAAAAIYLHPGLRTAVGIASWLGVGKVVWDAGLNSWVTPDSSAVPSTGFEYATSQSGPWFSSKHEACADNMARVIDPGNPNRRNYVLVSTNPQCHFTYEGKSGLSWVTTTVKGPYSTRGSSCPAGWYITPAGCSQTAPPKQLTQQEMIDLLNPANQPGWPMPDSVPNELPVGTPLPVELPIINPTPGANPTSKPLFVPTGDPVRNPSYNPEAPASPTNQPYSQPGTTVTPRPTTSNPWQVDVQPVDRPQAGADPLPDSEQNPNSEPTDKPKEENEKSLCEKHPDILACQKPDLDTPDGEIPKSTRDVSLHEENLFGGGSCPADVYFTPHGLQQMKIWDWNQSCGYITSYVKPILIICCTFAAFMILIPGRTE